MSLAHPGLAIPLFDSQAAKFSFSLSLHKSPPPPAPPKGPFTKPLNSTEVVKLVLLFRRSRKKRVLEV